ncbi:MAG: hypothetical protein QF692_03800 [Alphaproteobacteria bacterium]|jgi:hypothetical protein|nr:hypothetical protein [Alphaproteobacteria bacterium]MDP7222370.1 hypothetical protein [Alphaproteobacteria bacterium]
MPSEYYNFIGRPARIKYDLDGHPDFCEVFDYKSKTMIKDTALLEDIVNHHQSRKIDEADYTAMIEKLKAAEAG